MPYEYDVAIIGGGIQGCAVAQASAAAGFSTLIIEKKNWGGATSSSSSKLIHGGLRYLQTAQFSLVRESLAEREWMLDRLPDLVTANWFYIPIYKDGSLRPWKIFAGLTLYQLLSGFSEHSGFKRVPESEWSHLAGLKTEGLEAVFAYQDGQTDDRQLTEFIQCSAANLGAECFDNTRLTRAAKFKEGYRLCFKKNQVETCVKAKLIVNASGPWINHTLACFTPAIPPVAIDLVQGTHIIIEERISDRCFYLEAPSDHRAVFVLPWKGKTMIGTTETLHLGAPEESHPLEQEIDYLTATVKHYFPEQALTLMESFSGLRVLPQTEGRPFFSPRDVMLKVDQGLICIYGGKLTGWRHTAENVLREIEKQLGQRKEIDTKTIAM